jgi:deoxyribodipyrimidine photolyase
MFHVLTLICISLNISCHVSGDVSKCPSDTLVFEDDLEKASNALLARAWSPGWSNANKALTTFINGPLIEYSKNRRKADSATTSFLSPHLHFGEVSVKNKSFGRMKEMKPAKKVLTCFSSQLVLESIQGTLVSTTLIVMKGLYLDTLSFSLGW